MKQLLTSFLLLLSSSSSAIAQSLTTDGSNWCFCFCYYPTGEAIDVNHHTLVEEWKTNGYEIINGKQYHMLYRRMDFADMSLPIPRPEKYSAQGFIIDVRQQDGKIYAIKEQYLEYMKSLYPEIEDFYLGPAEDKNEVLLYDFTLNVGDTYPCADGATVTKMGVFSEVEGKERKIFHLSNGIIIIEDIGCVNSLGTLIAYQHTERITEGFAKRRPTSRTTWEWQDYMHQALLTFIENEGHYIFITDYIEAEDFNYFVIDNIATPQIVNSKSLNGQWYDLSGRRISVSSASSVPSVLPKGVYIRDGKKVVEK